MPNTSLRNLVMDFEISAVAAEILSVGLQRVYELPSVTALNNYATLLGGSAQVIATSGLCPKIVVINMNPSGKVVLCAGFTGIQQTIAYMLETGLVTDTNLTGRVNAFARGLYNTCRSALLTAIGVLNDNQVNEPLCFCSHSAGGLILQCALNDIKKNYAGKFTHTTSYMLGSPKASSPAATAHLTPYNIANFRNNNDFVNTSPPENLVRMLNSQEVNNVEDFFIANPFYSLTGHLFDLDRGNLVRRSVFDDDGTRTIEDIMRLIRDNQFPPEHSITAYTASLNQISTGRGAIALLSAYHDQLEEVRGGGGDVEFGTTILPAEQIPPVNPTIDMPTAIPGQTIVPQRRVIQVIGGGGRVSIGDKTRGKRAGVHDGIAKKRMFRILQDINYLERHDGRANRAKPYNSVALRREGSWGTTQEDALQVVISYLQKYAPLV